MLKKRVKNRKKKLEKCELFLNLFLFFLITTSLKKNRKETKEQKKPKSIKKDIPTGFEKISSNFSLSLLTVFFSFFLL